MTTIVYFDCFSGVAGDMMLAGLFDVGIDVKDWERRMRSMDLVSKEWKLCLRRVRKGAIAASHVDVKTPLNDSSLPFDADLKQSLGKMSKVKIVRTIHKRGSDRFLKMHNIFQENLRDISRRLSRRQLCGLYADLIRSEEDDTHPARAHAHHTHEKSDLSSRRDTYPHTHHHNHFHHHHHHNDHTFTVSAERSASTHGPSPHRNLTIISKMIRAATLIPKGVKDLSVRVFEEIAVAEGMIHGCSPAEVTFHEVGAVDSIVDTVGVILALHMLGAVGRDDDDADTSRRIFSSALPLGSGYVNTAHGILPVPAPATLHLIRGIPTVPPPGNVRGELVTPTGAALLRVLCDGNFNGPPHRFSPRQIGYGAGTKDFETHPNVLRVVVGTVKHTCGSNYPRQSSVPAEVTIGRPEPPHRTASPVGDVETDRTKLRDASALRYRKDSLVLLETNIDDLSPQILAFVCERLLQEKAADVWLVPIVMKKGRSAQTLKVLCERNKVSSLCDLIFRETTTLGIRVIPIRRYALRRRFESVQVDGLGQVRIKSGFLPSGERSNVHPEYEDCRDISIRTGVPLKHIMSRAIGGESSPRME